MSLITVPGELLSESATEAYVVPANTVTNRVNLSFLSTDSVAQAVRVWVVPSGESIADQYKIIGMESTAAKLLSGESRSYFLNQVLSAGDKIFWECDDDATDHRIVGHLDVNQLPASGVAFDGFTRLYFHGDDNTGYLPSSLTQAWEVPEDPAVQVVQMELLVHNKHTTREAFTVSAVPPEETPGDLQWLISSNTQQWHLAPGETRVYQFEHFLTPGYQIHWRALNASRIIGRLSVEAVRL